MNKEEYEIIIERYQTIIEDLYAALCELKQKNEQNEAIFDEITKELVAFTIKYNLTNKEIPNS